MNCYKMHCYAIVIHQLPSCNLFTLSHLFLFGETPLVKLWTPVQSFYIVYNHFSFSFARWSVHFVFHHSFNPLCFQQTGKIDNLPVSWGKVRVCVVCRSTFSLSARGKNTMLEFFQVLLVRKTLV